MKSFRALVVEVVIIKSREGLSLILNGKIGEIKARLS